MNEQAPGTAGDLRVSLVMEAETKTLEKQRKEGHIDGFTVTCDESERVGGDNSAPHPLAYFSLSIGF